MVSLFLLVNAAYRELAVMQSRQSQISRLIAATDDAYDLFGKYIYTRNESLKLAFRSREEAISVRLARLDAELPPDFHYSLYDLARMHQTFTELADSIRADLLRGVERIFLDKRLAELNRFRGYINGEYSRLLVDYLEHVRGRSEELRAVVDRSERVTVIVMALILLGGALLAGRISRGIASPIRRLADSLERFSLGELGISPLPVTRSDEIGVVVDSFNRMTTEIRAHVGEIREKAAIEAELADQRLRLLQAENALKRAEIRWLQNQVNPHFIYNAFNSILSLARLEDATRTASLRGEPRGPSQERAAQRPGDEQSRRRDRGGAALPSHPEDAVRQASGVQPRAAGRPAVAASPRDDPPALRGERGDPRDRAPRRRGAARRSRPGPGRPAASSSS